MNKLLFLRVCFWLGVVADLLATALLLFPEVAKGALGLPVAPGGEGYLYASRVGASLMLGWTVLLAWASWKPVERKGIILITVVPVLAGLAGAGALAVLSGFVQVMSMFSLWIFYAVLVSLYAIAYVIATGVERNHPRENQAGRSQTVNPNYRAIR